jgi:hypothetical protein
MPDELKPPAPAPEVKPPEPPAEKDEAAELRAELATVKDALKKGEMRGMSESTAHALLEQFKELNQRLSAAQGGGPVEKQGKAKGWLPF